MYGIRQGQSELRKYAQGMFRSCNSLRMGGQE